MLGVEWEMLPIFVYLNPWFPGGGTLLYSCKFFRRWGIAGRRGLQVGLIAYSLTHLLPELFVSCSFEV